MTGKSHMLDVSLAQRTGTPRALVRHMREEGGVFTMANGERVLFVNPEQVRKPLGYEAFTRWAATQV